jgi:hypothetical protein
MPHVAWLHSLFNRGLVPLSVVRVWGCKAAGVMLLSWAWLLQALGDAGLPGRNRSLLVRAYEYGGLRLADT